MDKLFNILEKENISVRYRALQEQCSSLYGLYLNDEFAGPIIILDQSLQYSTSWHRSVLAEEIGHYYTTPRTNYLVAYTSYSKNLIMNQDERKALKWATDFLIPDDDLSEAIQEGYKLHFELAELFNVTEWFMHMKVKFKNVHL